MFFLHCWHNESVMNDQTKHAKSALLIAVRVSLVLSRTVERRGRGFRTLNRFKLYYSLPGTGLLQNTVTWYKKTPCWMASTQWEREKKGYMLFEWCNLFAFLSLCAVCHPARFFFVCAMRTKGQFSRPNTRMSCMSKRSVRVTKLCPIPQNLVFASLAIGCITSNLRWENREAVNSWVQATIPDKISWESCTN